MPEHDEADLLAVILPRTAAAPVIRAAWDAGRAVTVLDPAAPAAALRTLLDEVAPTHLVDGDGERGRTGGRPVSREVAAVATTSGTTGMPKGIELTRDGMTAAGRAVPEAIGVTAADRWLVCGPLHHVAALAVLARAQTTPYEIVVHDTFDVDAVARAPEREDTTVVSLVPTMLHRLLAADAPLEQWQCVFVGGSALPPALRAQAEARGARVVETYGLSETWGGCVHDGRPQRGTAARLAWDGEVELETDVLMRGYRDRPEETAQALTADGWFRTGNLGAWTDDHRLRIIDRKKELVISGGVNVSLVEVEHQLALHPAVADVCIAGVPDDEWGERVVAYVVPRDAAAPPTLAELRAFALARLSAPKAPRELVLVDEIPRTASGKARRHLLRDLRGVHESAQR